MPPRRRMSCALLSSPLRSKAPSTTESCEMAVWAVLARFLSYDKGNAKTLGYLKLCGQSLCIGPVLLLFKLSFAETSYLDMYWMWNYGSLFSLLWCASMPLCHSISRSLLNLSLAEFGCACLGDHYDFVYV
jgi:hypothetical protein